MSHPLLLETARELSRYKKVYKQQAQRKKQRIKELTTITGGRCGAIVAAFRNEDFASMMKNFAYAKIEGLLDNFGVFQFFASIGKNLMSSAKCGGGHGHRYDGFTHDFYTVIYLLGGPRMTSLISANLFGPDTSTVRRWARKAVTHLEPGITAQNITVAIEIFKMYSDKMLLVGLAIDDVCHYDTVEMHKNRLYGFCGPMVLNGVHSCAPEPVEVKTFEDILKAFRENKRAKHSRALVLTPLHDNIPSICIGFISTCLSENAEFVVDEISHVERLWKVCNDEAGTKHILVGFGTDGAATRRAAMVRRALKPDAKKAIDHPSFVFGFSFTVGLLCATIDFQDWRHVLKRLVNHLRQVARQLKVGAYVMTIEPLRNILDELESGLRVADVERSDRQSVTSAQRCVMHRVSARLQELIRNGSREWSGLMWYISIIQHFLDVFVSNHDSVIDRIRKASYVVHALLVWKTAVPQMGDSVKCHFLTNQTMIDTLLAMHAVVNIIRFAGDLARDCETLPVQLEKTGSDECEKLFLLLGQEHVSQRSFTSLGGHRGVRRMNTVAALTCDGGRVKMFRAHTKRDVIWHRNYPKHPQQPVAVLCNNVSSASILEAWNAGYAEAVVELEKLSVKRAFDEMLTTLSDTFATWALQDEELSEVDDDALRNQLQEIDSVDEDEDDRVVADAVNAHVEALADVQNDDADDVAEPVKTLTTVDGPGDIGKLNVNMLLSLLNHNRDHTTISSDRLKRVRTKVNDALEATKMPSKEELHGEARIIYPGAIVAVIAKDEKDRNKAYIGSVFRITNRHPKKSIISWYDLRKQADLPADALRPLLLIKFLKPIDTDPHVFKQCSDALYVSEVDATSVLFRVTLLYDPEQDVHVVDEAYRDEIVENLEQLNAQDAENVQRGKGRKKS
jgi:hypothetical protein